MSLVDKIDNWVIKTAAANIADWFGAISARDLAGYAATQTDVAAMLPMFLTLPAWGHVVSRWTAVPYLRDILRGHRRMFLYEKILLYLADPRHYENRFFDHCLVLAWGQYDAGSPMAQMILDRFPGLATVSSVTPWYVSNMDRIVSRLIHQLEGGDEAHGDDGRAADGPRDNGVDPDPRGVDGSGVLPGQEGVLYHDMAFAVSGLGYDSGFDSDSD